MILHIRKHRLKAILRVLINSIAAEKAQGLKTAADKCFSKNNLKLSIVNLALCQQ